jgi:hypothetical protein
MTDSFRQAQFAFDKYDKTLDTIDSKVLSPEEKIVTKLSNGK